MDSVQKPPRRESQLGRARGEARLNQEIGIVLFLLLPSFTHLSWEMGQEL